jgi:S-DNA-T family DNA segregation ATPase FtsK/SpoIIIE
MMPRRSEPYVTRVDWSALALLAGGLLVALCVFSYRPATPSLNSATAEPAGGALTLAGELVARPLVDALGVSVYTLLAAWFMLVVLLVLRQIWWVWAYRFFGWCLLVPAVAVLADWVGPERLSAPLTGGGGSLGAWLAVWLAESMPPFAATAVVVATASIGLVLALDTPIFVVVRGVQFVVRRMIRRTKVMTARIVASLKTPAKAISSTTNPIPVHQAVTVPADEPAIDALVRDIVAEPGPVPIHRPESVKANVEQNFSLPPVALLDEAEPFPFAEQESRLRERAGLLEKTFIDFGLNVRVVGINTGPVITQYEVALETGLRVNKVTSLSDDLALNLRVPSVRIVAPIPGKNTVGIEVPNEHRATVRLKELLQIGAPKMTKAKLPLYLGKDTEGRPLAYDLAEMPHLLIAGRTGTGKSVCLNSVILSLLMTRTPEECKLILIDPKMLELSEYGKIPHLMHPVVTDMKKAEAILAWAVDKMEERYDLMKRARVRGIGGYNELTPVEIHRRVQPADEDEARRLVYPMPYVVIIIDEMGDLMMSMRKEVEGHIIRLAQKSRAAGIHLVVATQKPTVDVITGLIKSNLPARICFQVSSRTDSRVVLDEMGADKLLGKGDLLFLQPGTSTILRAQGTYASDEEIRRVVAHIEAEPEFAPELVTLGASAGEGKGGLAERLRARDELYEQAIEIIVREGRGSTSLLQRALGVGYGRAARLIDFMAEDGIVGNYNGSQAREVLLKPEQWEQMRQEEPSGVA